MFERAAQEELDQLFKRQIFYEIDRATTRTLLPLIQVFKYKFDINGYLVKFKARLCVRGDLQVLNRDNYAAILVIRYFRALIVLTAAFNLKILQLDTINTFLNSDIDKDIVVDQPSKLYKRDKVLKLRKALYSLKQALLLQYNYLVDILYKQGLQDILGVNCILYNHQVIIFFYIDDIIVLYYADNKEKVDKLLDNLIV